ncbi:unnamed protein product [Dracunculus medinensis]|uniref:Coatomer subunit epsilon n=1 Tax=Dracunculus medinensis TaxID=318479 RepID=A0A0N4UKG0_DRAME|nr:unnamed protein product [Dracunculus medinensis]
MDRNNSKDGCVSAHMLQLLYAYLVNGNMELIDTCLRDLRNSVEKSESNNHQIQFKLAKILGGIGEKGSTTAHYAKNLLDNAIQLWRKSEYLAEKVQRLMHYDDFKTAKPLAIEALQIDSQPEPQILLGIVRCFLAENQIEDALAQLEFVRVTHPAISQSSAIVLLFVSCC